MNALWVFGNVVAVICGALIASKHGAEIGITVGYALVLLVDIRKNTDKTACA